METQCPFIYAQFKCDENVSKVKPFELRVTCYGENCPSKMWETKRCINPASPEADRLYLGGHCMAIVNICETCKDLHKCKKSGDAKDNCRQVRIDQIFRVLPLSKMNRAEAEAAGKIGSIPEIP